jgi:hypothetical protein
MRSGSGTFETCPPILRMSVHRVDRKSPWSGQTDANGPEADPRHPGIEILRWLLRVAQ